LLDFLEHLGLHVKSNTRVAKKKANYTIHISVQEMVSVVSVVIENKILSCLNNYDHIAKMFDESTDRTVTKQQTFDVIIYTFSSFLVLYSALVNPNYIIKPLLLEHM